MLDRVLSKPKEIWARDRVRMLAITDLVCLFYYVGPGACSCACYDWPIRAIGGNDLKFGAVPAIQNCAMIDHFSIRVYR
jgi:hypothetical protein